MYPQGMIRRALGLGLLVTFVVLALSACGGGASGGEQQQAKARPLPEYPQELHAGTYHAQQRTSWMSSPTALSLRR